MQSDSVGICVTFSNLGHFQELHFMSVLLSINLSLTFRALTASFHTVDSEQGF